MASLDAWLHARPKAAKVRKVQFHVGDRYQVHTRAFACVRKSFESSSAGSERVFCADHELLKAPGIQVKGVRPPLSVTESATPDRVAEKPDSEPC